jgi:uncharacterized protein YxjI
MESVEITCKAFKATYLVRAPNSEELLMTVRKGMLVQGDKGAEVARLKGNFWNTSAKLSGADDRPLAHLAFPFPLTSLKKQATLHVGDQAYRAVWQADPMLEGKFSSGAFTWADDQGVVVMEIRKQASATPQFTTQFAPRVAREVAILGTVAIHQRFFQLK